VANHAQAGSQGYRSSVDRALAGYSTLLSAVGRLAATPTSEQPAVLISDLHENALVLSGLDKLVSGRPIFFPGDFGQYGSRAEAPSLVPRITRLGHPGASRMGRRASTISSDSCSRHGW
jgi:hypothetical protein